MRDIMRFYDYLARPSDAEKTVDMERRMGWSGVALALSPSSRPASMIKKLSEATGMDVVAAAEIGVNNPSKARETARKARGRFEVLIGAGGTPETNRAVVETPEFDMLSNHVLEGNRCGINHVIAKLARKNNVAVCIEFNQILMSYGKQRASLFSALLETARMCRKYNAPVIICSGAVSEWDVRSPEDLVAFGKSLGLNEKELKNAMRGTLLEENRKRLSGRWVMPGVEKL